MVFYVLDTKYRNLQNNTSAWIHILMKVKKYLYIMEGDL